MSKWLIIFERVNSFLKTIISKYIKFFVIMFFLIVSVVAWSVFGLMDNIFKLFFVYQIWTIIMILFFSVWISTLFDYTIKKFWFKKKEFIFIWIWTIMAWFFLSMIIVNYYQDKYVWDIENLWKKESLIFSKFNDFLKSENAIWWFIWNFLSHIKDTGNINILKYEFESWLIWWAIFYLLYFIIFYIWLKTRIYYLRLLYCWIHLLPFEKQIQYMFLTNHTIEYFKKRAIHEILREWIFAIPDRITYHYIQNRNYIRIAVYKCNSCHAEDDEMQVLIDFYWKQNRKPYIWLKSHFYIIPFSQYKKLIEKLDAIKPEEII